MPDTHPMYHNVYFTNKQYMGCQELILFFRNNNPREIPTSEWLLLRLEHQYLGENGDIDQGHGEDDARIDRPGQLSHTWRNQ